MVNNTEKENITFLMLLLKLVFGKTEKELNGLSKMKIDHTKYYNIYIISCIIFKKKFRY